MKTFHINILSVFGISFLFILFTGLAIRTNAQQIPLFSQYQQNQYIYNPAVAGVENFLDIRFMQRYQWRGITDAPRTFNLSAYSPIQDQKMGVGGILFADIVGPTRRTGFEGSYAYHLLFNDDLKLSFGLALGFEQYIIDGTQVQLDQGNDPALGNFKASTYNFLAKFGVYFNNEDFYVGFAIPQLFNDKLNVFEESTKLSKLEDHYILNGGYKFDIGSDFRLEPSVMLRYANPAPVQFDFSLWVYYQNMIWLGITYRTYDALSFGVGFNYNDIFLLGYSYDYTLSDLAGFSHGSHEIMLGIRFKNSQKSSEKPLLE